MLPPCTNNDKGNNRNNDKENNNSSARSGVVSRTLLQVCFSQSNTHDIYVLIYTTMHLFDECGAALHVHAYFEDSHT